MKHQHINARRQALEARLAELDTELLALQTEDPPRTPTQAHRTERELARNELDVLNQQAATRNVLGRRLTPAQQLFPLHSAVEVDEREVDP